MMSRPSTPSTTPTANASCKGAHLDGEMHGAWEFYRTDGSMMRSGTFERGKQTGTWRTYDRAGKVVKETRFKSVSTQPTRKGGEGHAHS